MLQICTHFKTETVFSESVLLQQKSAISASTLKVCYKAKSNFSRAPEDKKILRMVQAEQSKA